MGLTIYLLIGCVTALIGLKILEIGQREGKCAKADGHAPMIFYVLHLILLWPIVAVIILLDIAKALVRSLL